MAFDLYKTVATLRGELRELCKQRKFVEMRIVNVNLALRSLVREMDKKDAEEVLKEVAEARRKPAGLTEAISESLRQMPYQSLSANEVREWLEKEGFDLSEYSQPLATISVTLGRLAKTSRVKATRKGRKVTYRWIGD